ncbi:uncharacterized protein JCM6883_003838 [Sporobolomyces salmoneus]|uniref:uncharacterized protein n=1 Tax=Sporobolomyces salmoneus TaxID=183962 RepID=UPI003179ACF8
MSNSDKFQQDDAIVPDEPQVEGGVLGGSDEPLQEDSSINAPEGNEDSVSANKISGEEFKNDEFDGVSKDNIIDGERSTRGSNFAEADRKADELVESAVDANDGTSRVA